VERKLIVFIESCLEFHGISKENHEGKLRSLHECEIITFHSERNLSLSGLGSSQFPQQGINT
jgi:hypothetical protein